MLFTKSFMRSFFGQLIKNFTSKLLIHDRLMIRNASIFAAKIIWFGVYSLITILYQQVDEKIPFGGSNKTSGNDSTLTRGLLALLCLLCSGAASWAAKKMVISMW